MRLLVLLVWAALMAVGTRLLGWWTVPVLGALAPIAAAALGGDRWVPRQGRSVPRGAAMAAVLGWAALLAWAAVGPQFGTVAALVGTLLRAPWPAVALVTLLLPAVLAWSAAALAEGALALAHLPVHASDTMSPTRRDAGAALEPRSSAGLG
jgi:hypothetical protein